MFCFAVTGGIGSGKSYLVRLMSALGIPAYIADIRAKELYNTNRLLVTKLANLLGDDILSENGNLEMIEIKSVTDQKYFHESYMINANKRLEHRPIEDMAPFLDREVIEKEMVIKS